MRHRTSSPRVPGMALVVLAAWSSVRRAFSPRGVLPSDRRVRRPTPAYRPVKRAVSRSIRRQGVNIMRNHWPAIVIAILHPVAADAAVPAPTFGSSASVHGASASPWCDSTSPYDAHGVDFAFDSLNAAGNINGSARSGTAPLSSWAQGSVVGVPDWGSGSASSLAAMGSLHARSDAVSGASSPVASSASAQSMAEWFDTLTITSASLASGTSVTLHGDLLRVGARCPSMGGSTHSRTRTAARPASRDFWEVGATGWVGSPPARPRSSRIPGRSSSSP